MKRLRTLQGLDDKAFDSEFRNLNKVKHENVVQLLGYCYRIVRKYVPYKDELVMTMEMERILCFEYIEGGSLDKHIEGMIHGSPQYYLAWFYKRSSSYMRCSFSICR